MVTYSIYMTGAAFATSLLGNNRWFRGLGWLMTSILIAMVSFT